MTESQPLPPKRSFILLKKQFQSKPTSFLSPRSAYFQLHIFQYQIPIFETSRPKQPNIKCHQVKNSTLQYPTLSSRCNFPYSPGVSFLCSPKYSSRCPLINHTQSMLYPRGQGDQVSHPYRAIKIAQMKFQLKIYLDSGGCKQ